PGEPPRMSLSSDAPAGKEKTVQPVAPSAYSAQPISSPAKSNSNTGPSKSVRATRSSVSFEARVNVTPAYSARFPGRPARPGRLTRRLTQPQAPFRPIPRTGAIVRTPAVAFPPQRDGDPLCRASKKTATCRDPSGPR